MEWLFQYLLFFAQTITIVVAILAILLFIIAQRRKATSVSGNLEIKDISEEFTAIKEMMQLASLDEVEAKQWFKEKKKQAKRDKKQAKQKAKQAIAERDNAVKPATDPSVQGDKSAHGQPNSLSPSLADQSPPKAKLYLLAFNGSMDAHEVEDLRQEVTAVLAVVKPEDKVMIKLESPGGVVHGYGLAASQLMRFRQRQIPFTAIVDKVAASGGYMMACTANKIIAAPFAIIGSIGVVAQIPNFNRLLKKNDIDIELQTAGAYKRTLTMFGENTEEGRHKFQQELDETHLLFKDFVQQNRPQVNIEAVATGEHWFASQAINRGLVDEINTSDDVILNEVDNYKIISVQFRRRKKLSERLTHQAAAAFERLLFRNSRTS